MQNLSKKQTFRPPRGLHSEAKNHRFRCLGGPREPLGHPGAALALPGPILELSGTVFDIFSMSEINEFEEVGEGALAPTILFLWHRLSSFLLSFSAFWVLNAFVASC